MTTTEETTNESGWDRAHCTTWCGEGNHNHDPACWGGEEVAHIVPLSMEEGFPREAVEPYDLAQIYSDGDTPTVGVYAYRSQPGYREVVYLHIYRPSENDHLSLDCSVHLTGPEAVDLAQHLLRTAAMVDPFVVPYADERAIQDGRS